MSFESEVLKHIQERLNRLVIGAHTVMDGWYYKRDKDGDIIKVEAETKYKRCQTCKGHADKCYPRHRQGRSCY